jgi:hypothetical protein
MTNLGGYSISFLRVSTNPGAAISTSDGRRDSAAKGGNLKRKAETRDNKVAN